MADRSTQQQPLQAPPMTYNPNGPPPHDMQSQHHGQPHSHGSSQWSNSFWSCFSPMNISCMACWCPCILFGKTHHRLEDPTLSTYSTCNTYCCGWLALSCCGCQFVLQTINRVNMRERFGIEGSGFKDCLGAWCCPCCGIVQEEKEALLRIQGGGAAYQQNPQMAYSQNT